MTADGRQETGTCEACETERSEGSSDECGDDEAADHLSDVPVGSGCTEIWEHLAEKREDDG